MKKLITGFISLAFLALTFQPVHSQDMPEAHKKKDVTWHEIVMIEFKSGKESDAIDIIENHFAKAAEKADSFTPPKEFNMETGKRDLILVWDMDSISDMEWEVSPENEEWFKALSNVEGGVEKAHKILDKYQSYIKESKSEIATTDNN